MTSNDERVQRYIEALRTVPGAYARDADYARAVMAVADAEQAALQEWVDAASAAADRRMDQSIKWMERAEAAESRVAELRRILMQGGQDAASVRRESIAALTDPA